MQNNNFNNNLNNSGYVYFSKTKFNVIKKHAIKSFINRAMNKKTELYEEWSKLKDDELNFDEFRKDVLKKLEEMMKIYEKSSKHNSNGKEIKILMQSIAKSLNDFEEKIRNVKSFKKLNSNFSNNYSVEDITMKDLKPETKQFNTTQQSINFNYSLNNELNALNNAFSKLNINTEPLISKTKPQINGVRINCLKTLLENCGRYLKDYEDEEHIKNILKSYMAKIKENEKMNVPCLFSNSVYKTKFLNILKLAKKSSEFFSEFFNEAKVKHEQNKTRSVEFLYYILCALGLVNNNGRIMDADASRDFENLMSYLEQRYLK